MSWWRVKGFDLGSPGRGMQSVDVAGKALSRSRCDRSLFLSQRNSPGPCVKQDVIFMLHARCQHTTFYIILSNQCIICIIYYDISCQSIYIL